MGETVRLCPHCQEPVTWADEQKGACPGCGGVLVTLAVGGERVWSAEELAAAGGVNVSRIRQLCIAGRFPRAFKFAKSWAIPDGDARAWLTADRDRRYGKKTED